MLIEAPEVSVGEVFVVTTENGGHAPEFWAQTIADRIVLVTSINLRCIPVPHL